MIAHSPHPLFPYDIEDEPDEGAELVQIAHICVTRFDPTTNKYVWALETYKADELSALDQLFELYGGGKYELFAKTDYQGRPGSTVRRVRYDIPGTMKPLAPGDTMGRPVSPPAAPATNSPAPPGGSNMEQLFMMMMQSQQANTQVMVAMMQTMGQTMAAALANRGGGGSDAAAAALGQIAAAAVSRAPAETSSEALFKAMEMGAELAGGGNAQDANDEETAMEIINGVAKIKEMMDTPGRAAVPGVRMPPPPAAARNNNGGPSHPQHGKPHTPPPATASEKA